MKRKRKLITNKYILKFNRIKRVSKALYFKFKYEFKTGKIIKVFNNKI